MDVAVIEKRVYTQLECVQTSFNNPFSLRHTRTMLTRSFSLVESIDPVKMQLHANRRWDNPVVIATRLLTQSETLDRHQLCC